MRFNYKRLIVPATVLTVFFTSYLMCGGAEPIAADDMPATWQYTEAFDQTLPDRDDWWRRFDDPILDSLINLGVERNYNVSIAAHRIQMAQQSLRQTRAQYYPQINLNGSWSKARQSGMTTSVARDASSLSYFDLGLNANWQIDVFGKIYSQAKGAKAAYNASRADYDAVMLTICSKIATAYMQLRTLQAEMDVLNSHVQQQEHVKTITEARYEAGLSSKLDVAQACTNYYSTLAMTATMQSSITNTINTIGLLLGIYPEQIQPLLQPSAPMPDYHSLVQVGLPMELLRRRPDIVEAEYTLAQYAAAIGVAKKDFLPTISLSGSIGTTAHSAGDLFSKQSFTYSIAPTLSWSLFDGMGRSAALASAREQMQIGIDNYNNTVVTAVQEVDNAMTSYYYDLQYIDNIQQVVDQAKLSFDLSLDLYKQGLSAFINVSTAQISLLQYSNELVVARGQALADLINLYQALGGGF